MIKKSILLAALLFTVVSAFSQASSMVGKWKTIDDEDGSAKSIVRIFKATNGKYYAKIEELFQDADAVCVECKGKEKDQPIVGLMILNNMSEDGKKLSGGTILNPKDGKIYKCNITLEDNGKKLKVRGSLDSAGLLGKTQYWHKVN